MGAIPGFVEKEQRIASRDWRMRAANMRHAGRGQGPAGFARANMGGMKAAEPDETDAYIRASKRNSVTGSRAASFLDIDEPDVGGRDPIDHEKARRSVRNSGRSRNTLSSMTLNAYSDYANSK